MGAQKVSRSEESSKHCRARRKERANCPTPSKEHAKKQHKLNIQGKICKIRRRRLGNTPNIDCISDGDHAIRREVHKLLCAHRPIDGKLINEVEGILIEGEIDAACIVNGYCM